MERLLGGELPAFLNALAGASPGLRVNALRLAPREFEPRSPFVLERLPYPEGGYRVVGGPRPGKHPYHAAGLYYLQDAGAMAVGALLDPRPGERVLDLAAAPGGKATHIAALLGGEGVLVANDVHPVRARELAGNLERCGVRNAVVTNETAERLAERLGGWFDRVLVDAPCSGESMFGKSEAARADWSPSAVLGCARRQRELLRGAARLVRGGGLLMYSTCTFSPEENEGAVAAFLREHPDFEPEELPPPPAAAPGRPDWLADAERDPRVSRTLRLWPHRFPGAGHFVAALRRREASPPREPASGGEKLPTSARAAFEDFRDEHLRIDPASGAALVLRGQEMYVLPPQAPPLDGLRVLRPGWWLGTVQKGRFEPGHALALGLPPGAGRDSLDLRADGPDVRAYLRGQTLRSPGRKGWLLVRVDGYALGWGKRVGEVVKNHYPRGLRWS